jgi:hypothetical protein
LFARRRHTRTFEPRVPGRMTKIRAATQSPVEPPTWTIHEGECLAGLAGLPDGSVDVVITDPPYEAEAHTPERLVARTGGRLEVESLTFRRSLKSKGLNRRARWRASRQRRRICRGRVRFVPYLLLADIDHSVSNRRPH